MNKTIKINDKVIGESQRCFIIAEIGLNHNGDMKLAIDMIKSAAQNGADAVKFQSFITDNFYPKSHPAYNIFKQYEIDYQGHFLLKKAAADCGVAFISTPFCLESQSMLDSVGVDAYKIASSDINFIQLVDAVSLTGIPSIVSTGMSSFGDIEQCVSIFEKNKNTDLIILHCISNYPPDDSSIDLTRMVKIAETFGVITGFSDHTLDNLSSIASRTLGSAVIERHFTLDKKMPGPDQAISINPSELKSLRTDLDRLDLMLFHNTIRSDEKVRSGARRGLYAKTDINSGEIINNQNTIFMRPQTEITPDLFYIIDGTMTTEAYKKGTPIKLV